MSTKDKLDHTIDHEQHHARLSDTQRLQALDSTGLLDSGTEAAFDRAVNLATHALGTPVGLVSLVDGRRQFFKAQVGLEGEVSVARETPLSHSFCQYVASSDKPLAVEDARQHELLKNNGAVHDLDVIAYLGVPIRDPDGFALGSFCAIDSKPKAWTEKDLEILRDINAMLESEIKLKMQVASNELLVREMHHRVGNLFALVAGMISMTKRHAANTEDFSKALHGRLMALSRAHNLVRPPLDGQKTAPQQISLQNLLTDLIEPHLGRRLKELSVSGPTYMIGAKALTNVALIVHELATNAAKYGALSTEDGWLEIHWTVEGDMLNLVWAEHGGPAITEAPSRSGFGTRLVDMTIRSTFQGKIETDWLKTGIVRKLSLKLTTLES